MAKELPKMYQNKIEKNFDNIQKIYTTLYSDIKSSDNKIQKTNINNLYTIEQKIYNIFKSPTYIYKIDVVIETDEGSFDKRIIAKNKNNLITIDNEYIPINKIRDIYLK